MSSFRDLKNASGSDSKNVRDFASSDMCVSLGLSQTSYYVIIRFGKGISITFHLFCASSDCREDCHWSTAFPVLPDTIIILQTEPFDEIRHFQSGNTAHLAASTSFIVYNSK